MGNPFGRKGVKMLLKSYPVASRITPHVRAMLLSVLLWSRHVIHHKLFTPRSEDLDTLWLARSRERELRRRNRSRSMCSFKGEISGSSSLWMYSSSNKMRSRFCFRDLCREIRRNRPLGSYSGRQCVWFRMAAWLCADYVIPWCSLLTKKSRNFTVDRSMCWMHKHRQLLGKYQILICILQACMHSK